MAEKFSNPNLQKAKPKFSFSSLFKSKNTCDKAENYLPYTKAEVKAEALLGYGVHEVNARYTKDLAKTKQTAKSLSNSILTKMPPAASHQVAKTADSISFIENLQRTLGGSRT